MLRALVSIHDVMPDTRSVITQMLNTLKQRVPQLRPYHITLLVVPGKAWQTDDLNWLSSLVHQGHPLAGHGWSHAAPNQRTFYHHLHSLFLSRNAAEHLSRSSQELQQRVANCHQWFAAHHFPAPSLYVPPAWAQGCLNAKQWQALPFLQLETLSAVNDVQQQQRWPLPLTGYEADTPWRAWFLTRFNQWNKHQARKTGRPLRIGLHPFDLQYRLAQNAMDDLTSVEEFYQYSELGRLPQTP
jgi:predicted deacetylase